MEKKFDIRVVRMAKSTADSMLQDIINRIEEIDLKRQQKNKPTNAFLCLGHFDVMMIDQVTSTESDVLNKPIKLVSRDYNKAWDLRRMLKFPNNRGEYSQEENYYYPIYMMMQFDKNHSEQQEGVNKFWEIKTNFTVVTRIHQDYDSIIKDSTLFQDMLKSRLQNASNPEFGKGDAGTFEEVAMKYNVYYDIHVLRTGCTGKKIKSKVHYIFYDSLELGDVVCVSKSDSLSAILEVQRWLYESPMVNDVYSYCGIHYRNFMVDAEFPHDVNMLRKSQLDYVETRFSVRSADYAWEFLKDERKGYFVTGNADALLHYQNINEYRLIENVKKLVNLKEVMYTAFNDVVTRIGLVNRRPLRESGYEPKSITTSIDSISMKQETAKWLESKFNESNHPDGRIYVHSLIRLISTLNAMHSNSVTDALSQLMYGGIRALVQRIEYCCMNNSWSDEDTEELQVFLDQWTATTNSILHLESQLSQHPELVPVRYYIPAMILQFEQLIVDEGMEAISVIDDEKCRFAPIILPRSQSITTTEAILDPRNDKSYSGKAPLRIFIPINMLYHPWRVSHILCHEIAHYCGKDIRKRDLRNKNLIQSVAFYLASMLSKKMNVDDITGVFRKPTIEASNIIAEYMMQVQNFKPDNSYLDELVDRLYNELPNVLIRPEITREVIRRKLFSLEPALQYRAATRISIENYPVCDQVIEQTRKHLVHCLQSLYSECFADIVMICLTGCSFMLYYTSIFDDEFKNLTKDQPSGIWKQDERNCQWSEHYTDRIALVTYCISKIGEFTDWKIAKLESQDSEYKEWQKVAIKKINVWQNNSKDDNSILKWHKEYDGTASHFISLLGEEAKMLIDYLNSCTTIICDKMKDSSQPGGTNPHVSELRKRIKLLNPDYMDWQELQRILMLDMQKAAQAKLTT